MLRKPIGKQDQYMAAFGGITEMAIDRSGTVHVDHRQLPAHAIAEFVSKTHLYYTNVTRDAIQILSEQDRAIRESPAARNNVESRLLEIKEIGEKTGDAFRRCDFDLFGELYTSTGWQREQCRRESRSHQWSCYTNVSDVSTASPAERWPEPAEADS